MHKNDKLKMVIQILFRHFMGYHLNEHRLNRNNEKLIDRSKVEREIIIVNRTLI